MASLINCSYSPCLHQNYLNLESVSEADSLESLKSLSSADVIKFSFLDLGISNVPSLIDSMAAYLNLEVAVII